MAGNPITPLSEADLDAAIGSGMTLQDHGVNALWQMDPAGIRQPGIDSGFRIEPDTDP